MTQTTTSTSSSSHSRSMFASITSLLCALLVVCSFSSLPSSVLGSHFQFGSITWTRNPTNAQQYTFSMISGWRQCYQPFIDAKKNGQCPTVGDIVDVGSLFVFPLIPAKPSFFADGTGEVNDWNDYGQRPTPPGFTSQQQKYNTYPNTAFRANVLVTQLQKDADNKGADWFVGTNSLVINLNQVNNKIQPGGANKVDLPFMLMFMQCCRVSTLLDKNRDRLSFMGSVVQPDSNGVASINSPVTTTRIREFAFLNVPIEYSVPGQQAEKHALKYAFSPTTNNGLQSQLLNPNPTTAISTKSSSIDPVTGKLQWTPAVLGLVAIQFSITDTVLQNTIVLDIVFQVTDAKNAPVFIDPVPFYDFRAPVAQFDGFRFPVGFSRTISIRAQDYPKNVPRAIASMNTLTTDGISFSFTPTPNDPNGIGTGQLSYTAKLGATDLNVCFSCYNAIGLPSVKQYCITLIPGGDIILATGILRDFHRKNPPTSLDTQGLYQGLTQNADFDVTRGRDTQSLYVANDLGAGALPTFIGGAGISITADTFKQWWLTDNRVATQELKVPDNNNQLFNREQVNTIILTSGVTNDKRIYTYRSESFNPLEGALFGDELDPQNYFFTYEIHTSIDYKGGEQLEFWAADDLFVFFDGRLALALQGTSPDGAPRKRTINLDDSFTGTRKVFGTYRCDIFFAHRSRDSKPVIQIQIPDASLCDATTTAGTAITIPAGGWNANNIKTNGITSINGGDLLLTSTSTSSSGTAYLAQAGVTTGQRLLYGFLAEFRFTASPGTAQGFAFLMHNDALPDRIGASGPGLGYANSIANSLAIEFDMNVDATIGDPNYQHVSVHMVPPTDLSQNPVNSANEASSLGVSKPETPPFNGPTPPLTMNNGTLHYVKIQYIPASVSASNSCPKSGAIRVYMGVENGGVVRYNLFPMVTASIDGCALQKMWSNGAPYVGFSSSTGSVASSEIRIKQFALSIVKSDPGRTSTVIAPADIIAGQLGTFVVQARDACGNLITTGGEKNIAVTMTYIAGTSKNDFDHVASRDVTLPVVKDNGDGTYTVTYSSIYAGSYNIEMRFAGSTTVVGNKPWSINVRPDVTDKTKSVISLGNGIANAAVPSVPVGTTAQIRIQARDQFRNIQDRTTDIFKAAYNPDDASSVATDVTFDSSIAPAGTKQWYGRYLATFKAARSGDFIASIQLGGSPIDQLSNSPFTIRFIAGLADADKSRKGANTQGISSATAGQTAVFSLALRDGADNAIAPPKDGIKSNDVICPAPTTVPAPAASTLCTLKFTGTPTGLPAVIKSFKDVPIACAWALNTQTQQQEFQCQYQPTRAGVYSWDSQLLVNGRYMPGATLDNTLTVSPGIVAAATSGLNVGGRVVPAGIATDLTIQARDAFGNDRNTPNDDGTPAFNVRITDGPTGATINGNPGTTSQVTKYAGAGQYAFSFLAATKGRYTLEITLSGVVCGSNPLVAFVDVNAQGTPGQAIVIVSYGPAGAPSIISSAVATPQPVYTPGAVGGVAAYPPIVTDASRIVVASTGDIAKFQIESKDDQSNTRYDANTGTVIDPNDYIQDIDVTDRDGGVQKIPQASQTVTNRIGQVTLNPPVKSHIIPGAFWATRAGVYKLSATLKANGVSITAGTPRFITLSPGPVASASASGLGRSGGPTDAFVSFTVTLADQFANVRDLFDDFTVIISKPYDAPLPAGSPTPTSATDTTVASSRADLGAVLPSTLVARALSTTYPQVGSYRVQYRVPGQAGQFFRITIKKDTNILLTLDCATVANNLKINGYMDVVQPVYVAREGLLKMYECQQGKLAAAACPVVSPLGGPFDITLYQIVNGQETNILTGQAVRSDPAPSTLEPNAYYTYFTVNRAGLWYANASRNSINALAGPNTFYVLPGAVDPLQSTVVLAPLSIFAGQIVNATVVLKDSAGNIIKNKDILDTAAQINNQITNQKPPIPAIPTPDTYGVVVFFRQGATTVTVTSITQDSNGAFILQTSKQDGDATQIKLAGYDLSAYAVTVGFYVIGGDPLNAVPLAASPYALSVYPSGPSPYLSRFSPSVATLTFLPGAPTTVTVALADRFGNLVYSTQPDLLAAYAAALTCNQYSSTDIAALVVTATNISSTCTPFTPAGTGFFTATYTPKVSGQAFIGTKLKWTLALNGDNSNSAVTAATLSAHIGQGSLGPGLVYAALAEGSRSPSEISVQRGPLSSWNSELRDMSMNKIVVSTSQSWNTITAGTPYSFYFMAYDTSGKNPWRTAPGLIQAYVRLQGRSALDKTVDPLGALIDKQVDVLVEPDTTGNTGKYKCTIPAEALPVSTVGDTTGSKITGAQYTINFVSAGLPYTAYSSNGATYDNQAIIKKDDKGNVVATPPYTKEQADGTGVPPNLDLSQRIIAGIPFSVQPGRISWANTLIQNGLIQNGVGGTKIDPIKVSENDPALVTDFTGKIPDAQAPFIGRISLQFRDAADNIVTGTKGDLNAATFSTSQLPLDVAGRAPNGFGFGSIFLAGALECQPDGSFDADGSRPAIIPSRTKPINSAVKGSTSIGNGPKWTSLDGKNWISLHSTQQVGDVTLFLYDSKGASPAEFVERQSNKAGSDNATVSLFPCSLQRQIVQHVTASDPFWHTSYIIGNPVQPYVAGSNDPITFTVYTRDQYNNRLVDIDSKINPAVIKIAGTVIKPGTTTAIPIPSTWIVNQTLVNGNVVQVLNQGDGTYRIQVRPTIAGNVTLIVTFKDDDPNSKSIAVFRETDQIDLGNGIAGLDAPPQSFTVLPGPPADFADPPELMGAAAQKFRAGVPFSFQLSATDAFQNAIFSNKHTFIITLRSISPTVQYQQTLIPQDLDVVNAPGVMRVTFTNTWHDRFQFSIQLNYTRYDATAKRPGPPAQPCSDIQPYACVRGGCRGELTGATGCNNPDIKPAKLYSVTFLHATCAYAGYVDNNGNALTVAGVGAATPFRCHSATNDDRCAATYQACGNLPTPSDVTKCPYPSPDTVKACGVGNHCPSVSGDNCPLQSNCPLNTVQCGKYGGCRAQPSLCPSDAVCPPTYVLCPDRLSCAFSLDKCTDAHTLSKSGPAPVVPVVPVVPVPVPGPNGTTLAPTTPTTPTATGAATWNNGLTPTSCGSLYRCRDGRCLARAADCATPKTCRVAGQVVCPDGSCKASASQCPDIYECRNKNTNGNVTGTVTGTLLRCADGSCRKSLADCPTGVTCPIGQLLCENNRCAPSLDACPAVPVIPPYLVRCADGSAVNNIEHCPSLLTCNPARPVLCSNGACVSQVGECSATTTCPDQFFTCPDGSCVPFPKTGAAPVCPTNIACPAASPVLCQDGSCVSSGSECGRLPSCPVNLPLRCADGSCRGNLADCPSRTVCPNPAFPVLCPDQSCRASVDLCQAVVCPKSADPTDPVFFKCPGGECALALALCPTHVTCPTATSRCQDGSCRFDCGNTTAPATCPGTLPVSCPHVGAGVVCARTLTECPADVVCPSSAPVRCLDATCAATLSDCPAPPADDVYSSSSPCPDGSWTASGTQSCPTPVSCPLNAPYKCVDNTCRIAPEDCPLVTKCTDPAKPYRCPNGRCGATPTDSTCQSEDLRCLPETPLRCPQSLDENAPSCVADLGKCGDVLTGVIPTKSGTGAVLTVDGANGVVNTGAGCPNGKVRCRDGSCVLNIEICKTTTPACPQQQCSNGLCVANRDTDCAVESNTFSCLSKDYVRCPKSGRCAPESACADLDSAIPPCDPSTPAACDDGSCAPLASDCPTKTGCADNQFRCLDGTCAFVDKEEKQIFDDGSAHRCTSPDLSSTVPNGNVCPVTRPFRCQDGLCAVSSTACPAPLQGDACSKEGSTTPFTCADGRCVQSSSQCAVIRPCSAAEQRCGDGTCRLQGRCPRGNTCPVVDGQQYQRCDTGRCVLNKITDCAAPGSDEDMEGCSPKQVKCNGLCVSTTPTTVNGTIIPAGTCDKLIVPSNGCPKDKPRKCFNGACVAQPADGAPDTCPTIEGCPFDSPFFCPQAGTCTKSPDLCGSATTCAATTPIRCADGRCAATPAACNAANSCPATAPVRCVNGACKKYASSFTPISNEADAYCGITVTCSDGDVACYDGSCRASATLCPPTLVCKNGFERCADGTCRSSSTCPLACPASSPALCDSGACRASSAECGRGGSIGSITGGGGTLGGGTNTAVFITPGEGKGAAAPGAVPSAICKTAEKPYECFDGTCATGALECQYWAAKVRGQTGVPDFQAGRLTDSTPNPCPTAPGSPFQLVACPNGECKFDLSLCPVIPACPALFSRCPDGTCTNSTSCADGNFLNGAPVPCSTGNFRCQDGSCRSSCRQLQYDGCPHTTAPFHCANRECAVNADSCPPASRHGSAFVYSPTKKFGVGRRLLQTGDGYDFFPSPCYANCRASVKAKSQAFSISSSSEYDLTIATDNNGNKQARMIIPTGAFGSSRLTNLQIVAVGESRMRDAENFVDSTRRGEFGSYMTMVETVLSVAFECRANVSISAASPILYKASIDQTYLQTLDDGELRDICLAQLFQIPEIGFTAWRCVLNAGQRTDNPTAVRPIASDVKHLLTGTIPTCAPIVSAAGETSYPIYAFIHQPVRNPNIDDGPSWVKRNLLTLLLILVGIVVFLAFLIYAINRLHRYRGKYHEERIAVQKQQEEVDEMEQFGGHAGVKDDEVEMMSNPMVIQMKDMQAQLDAKNQEMRLAEQQSRAQQSAVRQDHIQNLQHDRDALAMELERLRQELAAQNAAASAGPGARRPMPQNSHTNLIPSHPGMIAHEEPQHTDFQAARPKRRGKDF